MNSRVIAVSMMTAAPIFWPAVLSAQTPDDAAATMALLMRSEGCVVTEATSEAFRERSGLTEAEARDAAAALYLAGAVDLRTDGGGEMRLIPALCDAAAHDDMRVSLVALLRINGCAMTDAAGEAQAPGFGLTPEMTAEAGNAMFAAGELVERDGRVALSDALCEGAEGPLVAPRGVVIAALRGADCVAPESLLVDALASVGGDPQVAPGLLLYMASQGDLSAEGDGYRLDGALCAGSGGADFVDPVERIVATMRGMGCSASEDSLEPVIELLEEMLPEAVMEAAEDRFEAMIDAGDIIETGDLLVLSEALCGGDPGLNASVTDRLVAEARARDCRISRDEAVALLAGGAMREDEIGAAGDALVGSDQAILDGDMLVLSPMLCAGGAGPLAGGESPLDRLRALDPADVAFDIDVILRAAGCAARVPSTADLDAALAAPLAGRLGVAFGADPAVDDALRMLAVGGLNVLRGAGRAAWDPATGAARLTACP